MQEVLGVDQRSHEEKGGININSKMDRGKSYCDDRFYKTTSKNLFLNE